MPREQCRWQSKIRYERSIVVQETQNSATNQNRRQTAARIRIVGFLLIVAFVLLKPRLDAWLGNEQSAPQDESSVVDRGADNEQPDNEMEDDVRESSPRVVVTDDQDSPADARPVEASQTQSNSKNVASTTKLTDTPPKANKSPSATSKDSVGKKDQDPPRTGRAKEVAAVTEESKAPPGKLSKIAGTEYDFVSTAGLMYLPGSADGHRLKHVLKHSKDDLSKPVHGVFSGDRDQILAWIDIAFEKGKKGGKGVKREEQRDRLVYTVDLGEKIGYVGGQVGERKNHPPCRYLRLVIEGRNEVVTAYPSDRL